MSNILLIGSRGSPLARAQVEEIQKAMQLDFDVVWVQTTGDLDQNTSLRGMEKSDFFTRELDEMLLRGQIDAAIHSAKDLPDPLPNGLKLAAVTQGVDPRDSLVMREYASLETLPREAVIATSSKRREEQVLKLRKDFQFIDLRGTIHERIAKLRDGTADGVVVAEAALIRLKLTHLNRVFLPGKAAPLQGRLAVIVRAEDAKVQTLFSKIHASHALSGT